MALRPLVPAVLASLLATAACGGSSDPGGGDAGADPDGAPGSDARVDPDGFVELITGTWSLSPGSEGYYCARKTVSETVYITGFRALAPLGTHHTVVSVGTSATSDGEGACQVFDNHRTLLYASGVGTDDWHFPEGVAVKVEAGQQLLLNLHLFNASDSAYTDVVSGTLVKTVPEEEVSEVAELIFAGPVNISLDPTGEPIDVTGGCTFSRTATVLNVWPHMHQLGRHMKVVHGQDVLHDAAYQFSEQKNYPLASPLVVQAGERLQVTCTFVNDTDDHVGFGDSTNEEMCFAGFYRYPASGSPFLYCSN